MGWVEEGRVEKREVTEEGWEWKWWEEGREGGKKGIRRARGGDQEEVRGSWKG